MHGVDQKIINCVKIRKTWKFTVSYTTYLSNWICSMSTGTFLVFVHCISYLPVISALRHALCYKGHPPGCTNWPRFSFGCHVTLVTGFVGFKTQELRDLPWRWNVSQHRLKDSTSQGLSTITDTYFYSIMQRKKFINNWFEKSIDMALCLFWTWNNAN